MKGRHVHVVPCSVFVDPDDGDWTAKPWNFIEFKSYDSFEATSRSFKFGPKIKEPPGGDK